VGDAVAAAAQAAADLPSRRVLGMRVDAPRGYRDAVVRDVVTSGVRLLFVGLGCPKQERWMHEHRDRLPIVTIGVGAAFDFLAGSKRQAPRVLQRVGLEWAFRLVSEPRRLWRRYLRQNPRFVALFAAQLLRGDR
jgi:N-acetylglucosaminyldiphosphoundecaprenol N-acetyl-beta-D-mannosaminyltransferase